MAPATDLAGLITAKDAWGDLPDLSSSHAQATGLPVHSQFHDERTMAYLEDTNNNIGTYYWIAIVILLLVTSIVHYINQIRSLRRRHQAGKIAKITGLPVVSLSVDPALQKRSSRHAMDACCAVWRKYSTRRLEVNEIRLPCRASAESLARSS